MTTPSLQKLSSRHRRIMEFLVYDGATVKEAAAIYGITESRLSIITRSPIWKKEEDLLREVLLNTAKRKLETLVPEAINTLAQGMKIVTSEKYEDEDGNEREITIVNKGNIRNQAAKEILERAGIGAKVDTGGGTNMIFNMYAPKWMGDGEKGKAIDVEVTPVGGK